MTQLPDSVSLPADGTEALQDGWVTSKAAHKPSSDIEELKLDAKPKPEGLDTIQDGWDNHK